MPPRKRQQRYQLSIAPTARRQLAEELAAAVAFAAYEFITGARLDNPYRVGKPLHPPLQGQYSARRGTYRVIYRIDDDARVVIVLVVAPRRDAYRTG